MASIFIRTALIYFFLSLMMKFAGKRQVGELETGEVITTLLISEIAALPIDEPDLPLLNAVIPIVLLVCGEVLLSAWKQKSKKAEDAMDGSPEYLIYKGRILQDAMVRNRVSLSELLSVAHGQGVGHLSDIGYAILESDGTVSVLKKRDLAEGGMAHVLIADGKIEYQNVSALGIAKKDLSALCGGLSPGEIYLLTIDDRGKIERIRKRKGKT